ncbi:hypothetical protein J6590_068971 [Homalodisca vitripennis]|nr:hypothetical protein J6590_068971 [Homalodisca vitripennis]
MCTSLYSANIQMTFQPHQHTPRRSLCMYNTALICTVLSLACFEAEDVNFVYDDLAKGKNTSQAIVEASAQRVATLARTHLYGNVPPSVLALQN